MLSKTEWCYQNSNEPPRTHTDTNSNQLLHWKSVCKGHSDGERLGQTDIKSYYLCSDSLWRPHNISVQSKALYKNMGRYRSWLDELIIQTEISMKFWHFVSSDIKFKPIQL